MSQKVKVMLELTAEVAEVAGEDQPSRQQAAYFALQQKIRDEGIVALDMLFEQIHEAHLRWVTAL